MRSMEAKYLLSSHCRPEESGFGGGEGGINPSNYGVNCLSATMVVCAPLLCLFCCAGDDEGEEKKKEDDSFNG